MIPSRFRKTQEEKVPVPYDVQRLFTLYEANKMSEADLIRLLKGELDLHPEFSRAVKEKVLAVIRSLQRNLDAREACKADTGIAAVPTVEETKIVW